MRSYRSAYVGACSLLEVNNDPLATYEICLVRVPKNTNLNLPRLREDKTTDLIEPENVAAIYPSSGGGVLLDPQPVVGPYRGTSPMRKRPTPYDPPMALEIGLR